MNPAARPPISGLGGGCEEDKAPMLQPHPAAAIRLLLVDDNHDDAILTIALLGTVAPATYVVTWADTFERGRALLVGNRFDACLIDYHLGSGNGLDLLTEAVAQGCTAPIILVTGNDDEKIDRAAMRVGAAGFLVKGEFEAAALDRSLRYAIAQRTSELNLRVLAAAIVDSSHDAIISTTLGGVVTSWNKSAERMFGFNAASVIGQSLELLCPSDRAGEILEMIAGVASSAAFHQHETVWMAQGGVRRVHVSLTISPTHNVLGELVGLSVILYDVSKRKHTEALLLESRDLLHAVVDGSPDAIYLEDLEGRYLMCNPAGAALAGLTVAEVVGRTGPEVFPQHAQLIRDRARHVIRSGETLTFQDSSTFDGATRTFVVTRSLFHDAEGAAAGVLVIGHEITDRKQSEEALDVTAATLARAQEIAHLGNWRVDFGSGEFHWSEEACRILGMPPDSGWLTKGALLERLHPDDRALAIRATEDLLDRGIAYNHDLRFVHPGGETRTVNVQKHVVRDAAGKPLHLVGTLLDITARKKAEAALRLSDEQLRQAQKMDAIGRLAGGVAHDFNNMLSVINGYASLLLTGDQLPQSLQTPVAEILEAGERAASLTRQLLVFSRKQDVQLRPLRVNKALVGIESMLRCMIGEDINLVTDFAPDVGYTQADPVQLDQIMINLAVNARDAMPGGGTLTMSSRMVDLVDKQMNDLVSGTYIVVTVTDSGCGMDESVQAHVFEPFFTTKGEGQGTGLGLATVYGIVKQLGGHIEVRSKTGHGSTFEMYLLPVEGPLKAADDDQGNFHLRGTETILVVEDESSVRVLIRSILAGYGYRVLEAGHGEEALRIAAREDGPIHLLLTDAILSDETGRQVAASLTSARPEMRVIYMSAYSAEAVLRKGAMEPGVPIVEKPVLPSTLARKVREVLDAAGGITGAPLVSRNGRCR